MTQTSAFAIVQDYHRARTSGDVERAMTWVADDITCRAPGADLDGKEAYRQFIGGFAPALTGLADIATSRTAIVSRCSITPDRRDRDGAGCGMLHSPGGEDRRKRAHLRPPLLRPTQRRVTEALR